MKFNQALIAAVAASAMLMSPVFAQGTPAFDCSTVGRQVKPNTTPGAAADCGDCIKDYCPLIDPKDADHTCVKPNKNEECDTANFGKKCKTDSEEFTEGNKKVCVNKAAKQAAEAACNITEKAAGKTLKLNKDEDAVECVCEFGTEKVADKDVCRCSVDDSKVRNVTTNMCGDRPVFDCLKELGRNAPQSPDVAYFASKCGGCHVSGNCKSNANDDYSCIAPSDENGTKCNNGTGVLECKEADHVLNVLGKCGKKAAGEHKPLTDAEKCTAKNRFFETSNNTCLGCIDDKHAAPSKEGDYMCFPIVTKDVCEKESSKTHRFFEETSKLCLCKPPMKAAKAEEESSTTAHCISGAGQLVISSIVVLSSMLASALFFL